MRHYGLPYSNVLRASDNCSRLTGVMLMRTRDYYTPRLLSKQVHGCFGCHRDEARGPREDRAGREKGTLLAAPP